MIQNQLEYFQIIYQLPEYLWIVNSFLPVENFLENPLQPFFLWFLETNCLNNRFPAKEEPGSYSLPRDDRNVYTSGISSKSEKSF